MKFLRLLVIVFLALILPGTDASAQFLGAKAPSFNNSLVDAADSGNEAAVLSLLQSGTSADVRGSFGVTPLMRAAFRGNKSIAELLLNAGASAGAVDKGGATSLHLASKQGYAEIADLLIKYDALVDARDNDGWTPLMRAAINKHESVVQKLIDSGANVNLTNNLGETALMHAANSGDKKIIDMLILKGADTEITSKSGNSALRIAEKQRNEDLKNIIMATRSRPIEVEAKPIVTAEKKTPNIYDDEEDTKELKKSEKSENELIADIKPENNIAVETQSRVISKKETRKIINGKTGKVIKSETKLTKSEDKKQTPLSMAKKNQDKISEPPSEVALAQTVSSEPKDIAAEEGSDKAKETSGDDANIKKPVIENTPLISDGTLASPPVETAENIPDIVNSPVQEPVIETSPIAPPLKKTKKNKSQAEKMAKKTPKEPLSLVYKKEMAKNKNPAVSGPANTNQAMPQDHVEIARNVDIYGTSTPAPQMSQPVFQDNPLEKKLSEPKNYSEPLPAPVADMPLSKTEVEVAEAIRVPVTDYTTRNETLAYVPPVPRTNDRYQTGGNIWMEIGRFQNMEEADLFIEKVNAMRIAGLDAYALSSGSGRNMSYRVKLGDFSSEEDARKFCEDNFPDSYGETGQCSLIEKISLVTESKERVMPGYLPASRYDATANQGPLITDSGYSGQTVFWIQLGHYVDQQAALERWSSVQATNKPLLGKMAPRFVDSGNDRIYLRSGPFFTSEMAKEVCEDLRKKSVSCITVKD